MERSASLQRDGQGLLRDVLKDALGEGGKASLLSAQASELHAFPGDRGDALPQRAEETPGLRGETHQRRSRKGLDPQTALPTGSAVALSVIEQDRASRARYLRAAHECGREVKCLCRSEGIPLGVAKRKTPEEIYYLYPLHRADPLRHTRLCPHYHELPEEGSTAPGKPVVESIGGRIRVHVASAVFSRPAPTQEPQPANADEALPEPRKRAPLPRGSLLSLLCLLWEEAELARWHPAFAGRRGYGVVASRLARLRSLWT